ncbi:MAG: hypothetical protein K9J24_10070 [Bacteroidales bacterium]|nr:hypothetical protein [Bacteroidales bacterium]
MTLNLKIIPLIIALFWGMSVYAQDRIDSLEIRLDTISNEIPALKHEIDLSVSKISIQEFIRSMANLTDLNISISPDIQVNVTNNFADVPVKDVLLFLCREYDLDLVITGNIISVIKYRPPVKEYVSKPLQIIYYPEDTTIDLNLRNDSLVRVARRITEISGINVICPPELNSKLVSLFVRKVHLLNALDKLALANNLELTEKDKVFIFNSLYEAQLPGSGQNRNRQSQRVPGSEFIYTARDKQNIDVYAVEMPIGQVIAEISKELDENYFLLSDLTGNINLNLEKASYEEFLAKVFNGTSITYIKQDGVYLIGDRLVEGLRETKIVPLQYRSIVDLTSVIPENLKKDVTIIEFVDMNSFILSGSAPAIRELEYFISDIDKTVPLVLIEVIIIDNQTGYAINTGITAGVSDKPVQSGGKLYPGIDYTFNSESINKLLNSFNGFGLMNLGKVNPNFYLTIQAMEEAGLVKVRSTPKLSTLNGHEATLSIGNTEYYLEERTDFIVNQSTSQKTTAIYKSVTAEFKLVIQPVVSGDDHITLNVSVDQSDFTGRISKQAPPGQVSRSFSSLIRIGNEEMVLLGGLEEKTIKNTGSGWPLLSRIPILKWLFSSQSRENQDNKLNIFIKPTVIY